MAGIGVNLRVTGHCSEGGRQYMEDMFAVAWQRTEDLTDMKYAFFAIFDGHGGSEAAKYAKKHLLANIVKEKNFWSDNDKDVLQAIRDGYVTTHNKMWKKLDKWPKTNAGFPSTSGTTATIGFIQKGKLYIGHVGDSCIVLGYQDQLSCLWKATKLTRDHKPENENEKRRIQRCGGKVANKSGVNRVVWNRPQSGHQGPVRRSTPIDEIPFLAVARSLGDFWSYNYQLNRFVVSPEPDVYCFPIDIQNHKCLIFGTDGLWNVLSPSAAVSIVQDTEMYNASCQITGGVDWRNPSKQLVDTALKQWQLANMRADNTSVLTLFLEPPGPPNSSVLVNRGQLMEHLSPNCSYDASSSDTEEFHRSVGLTVINHDLNNVDIAPHIWSDNQYNYDIEDNEVEPVSGCSSSSSSFGYVIDALYDENESDNGNFYEVDDDDDDDDNDDDDDEEEAEQQQQQQGSEKNFGGQLQSIDENRNSNVNNSDNCGRGSYNTKSVNKQIGLIESVDSGSVSSSNNLLNNCSSVPGQVCSQQLLTLHHPSSSSQSTTINSRVCQSWQENSLVWNNSFGLLKSPHSPLKSSFGASGDVNSFSSVPLNGSDISRKRLRNKNECEMMVDENGSSDVENQSNVTECKKRRISLDNKSSKIGWPQSEKIPVDNISLKKTKRTLRSDTLAAMPVKTLRSRNVDLRDMKRVKPCIKRDKIIKVVSSKVVKRKTKSNGLRLKAVSSRWKSQHSKATKGQRSSCK